MPESPEILAAKQKIIDLAVANVERMHWFRKQHDEANFRYYKQFVNYREPKTFPDGMTARSNISFPYAQSNVETITSRVHDAFFSFDPWFECYGRGVADEPPAEKMGMVLQDKLRKAKLPSHFETLVKSACIYRIAGWKVDWDFDYDLVDYLEPVYAQQPVLELVPHPETGEPIPQPVIDPATGQPQMQNVPDPENPSQPLQIGSRPAQKKVPRKCPKLIPIDVFDLLVDPDGGIGGMFAEKTFGTMKREMEVNPNLYFPEAIAEIQAALTGVPDSDSVIIRMAEVWNEIDGTYSLITFKDIEGLSWKDARYAIRGTTGQAYKRQMYGGKVVLLAAGPNPFSHKKCPVLTSAYMKNPYDKFGISAVEAISDLVERLSRFVGMIEDNWTMGVNARYGVNSDADFDRASLQNINVPGAMIEGVGDPNTWLKRLETHTPTAGDYNIIELVRGMIENGSGVSDFYSKGVGSAGGNDTATGISSVISEANYRFKIFIRNLELDILQPTLDMCASMCQQFLSDDDEILITDERPLIPKLVSLKPEEIVGGFSFVLVAANYATNKTVKQRQLMAFGNIVKDSPFLNQAVGIRTLGKAMEIREINQLIKSDEQVQAEQQQSQQMQLAAEQHAFELNEKALNAQFQRDAALLILKGKIACECGAKSGGGSGGSSTSAGVPKPSSTDFRAHRDRGGRPPSNQHEGAIPGAGNTSVIRSEGQQNGANALGLEGLGEVGAG